MMKALFFSDTHLGFDYPLKPKVNKPRRGIDFFRNFDIVLEYALNHKVDVVLHGGDLFYRTKVPTPIIDMVYERIFAFAEKDIPFIIVPGNHESSRLPQSIYLNHRNIHIFHQAELKEFNLGFTTLKIVGFPFVRKNIGDFLDKTISKYNSELNADYNLLLMHQAIEGSQVGPSNFTFRKASDVIAVNELPSGYDAILSGHIHRQQVLWKNTVDNGKVPIIYPGSIERTSFAEKDEVKGFYTLNFSDKNTRIKFAELPSRPMIDLVFNCETYTNESLKNEFINTIKSCPENAVVRIKMQYPENLDLLTSSFINKNTPRNMIVQISGF